MRDNTGGRAEAQAQSQAFFARRGRQRAADKAAGRGTRMLDDIPPDLIFFWRVIGLIRGLCSALRVRLPYLDILGARRVRVWATLTLTLTLTVTLTLTLTLTLSLTLTLG